MKYKETDFLDTADPVNKELSIRCRELTREYYLWIIVMRKRNYLS